MFNTSLIVSFFLTFSCLVAFAQNENEPINSMAKRHPVSKLQSPAEIQNQKILKERTQKASADFQVLIKKFHELDLKGQASVLRELDQYIENQDFKKEIPSAQRLFELNNVKAMDNLFRGVPKKMILLYQFTQKVYTKIATIQ